MFVALNYTFIFRKATSENVLDQIPDYSSENEGEEFGEDETNKEQSDEEYVEDTTPTSIIKTTLQNLSSYWSGHFVSDVTNIVHGFQTPFANNKNIKLYVSELSDLSHTWLMDLVKNGDGVETHWTETLLNPMNKSPYLPKQSVKEFPKRLPIKFADKQAEKFFTSPSLGAAGKKITLPSVIFTHEWSKMPDTDDYLFEYYGRQGACDGQITHKLLTLERDIITNIIEVVESLEVSNSSDVHLFSVKEALKCLADTNTLTIQSNFRAKSMSIVTACKAKLNIRETILNKFNGDNSIKEALKGSSFFSSQLFGPISSTLQDKLDSYINRSEAKLSPKPYHSKIGSSTNKRGRGSNPRRGARKTSRSTIDNLNSGVALGTSQYVQPAPAPSLPSGPSSGHSNPLFHERPRRQPRGRNPRRRGSRNS